MEFVEFIEFTEFVESGDTEDGGFLLIVPTTCGIPYEARIGTSCYMLHAGQNDSFWKNDELF